MVIPPSPETKDETFWSGFFRITNEAVVKVLYGIARNLDGMTVDFDASRFINEKILNITLNNLPNDTTKWILQIIADNLKRSSYTGSSADYTVDDWHEDYHDNPDDPLYDSCTKLITKHPDPARGCSLDLEFQSSATNRFMLILYPDLAPTQTEYDYTYAFTSTVNV